MQKTLISDALHHEADFVGVGDQDETRSGTADESDDVVDPGATNIACETRPAPLEPILDRVFMPSRAW
jgi:hypothetical protein